MRLSRKMLATVGLVATTAIGGALIYALQPSGPKSQTELYETDSRATTDSLEEQLFALAILGDDRAIAATYSAGVRVHQR